MNSRKILLVLAVLVLLVLVYKMSEKYVYSNTVPMDLQTLLEQKEMGFTEDQKEILVVLYTGNLQNDPKNILKTLTDNQRNAFIGILEKYKPQLISIYFPNSTEPVKKFVPPNVTGFSCTKSPDRKRFDCSFS